MENQKIPETLEEQRDYYLKLYEKWARWQKSEELKIKNRDLWNLLQMIPFNSFENNNYFNLEFEEDYYSVDIFLEICLLDQEIQEILLFGKGKILMIANQNLFKKLRVKNIENEKLLVEIRKCSDNLSLFGEKNYALEFENCSFSHITLENFDRGYFSPETNNYLNQMENEGKLTLINCTWSGLPQVTQNVQNTSLIQNFQTTWSQEINFVNGTYRYKVEFNQYLAFFEHFLTNIIPNNENKKVDFSILSKDKGVKILIQTNDFEKTELDNFYQEYIKFFFEPEILEEYAFQFNQNPETMRAGLIQSNYSRILDLKKEVNRLKFDIDEQKNIFQRTMSENEKETVELKQALGTQRECYFGSAYSVWNWL